MRQRTKPNQRSGSAVLELCIVLPLLLLFLLATIETTSMIFLKQAVKIAAYEAVRTSIVPGSTSENVQAGADDVIKLRRVKGASVTITPNDYPSSPYGTPITVKVTAACKANSLFLPWFYGGKTMVGEVTMMKETEPK
jgi:Flp pilus assembly protein TadG